jgi:hypothetical protein
VFDVANVFGHIAADTANTYSPEELDQHIRDAQRKAQWEMNHQEAAIFLQEGQDNDKFYAHPKNQNALPAYFIAHNKVFYAIDFIAAMMLLSLSLLEKPAVITVPIAVSYNPQQINHTCNDVLGKLWNTCTSTYFSFENWNHRKLFD